AEQLSAAQSISESLQWILQQEASLDRHEPLPSLEPPGPARPAVHAGAAPIVELLRARHDRQQLVFAGGEPADPRQCVGGERAFRSELRAVVDVLQGTTAALLDDGTGRDHARGAGLDDAQRARMLESALAFHLRLDQVARCSATHEDDATIVAREPCAAV